MKAAVLEGLNRITVREMDRPTCGPKEAILKVMACAVCGSDIRIYHYGNDRVKYPAVIGHEIAGEVVEVGSEVARVKSGDRIALGADVPCGTCYWCTNGMGTNCSINYAVGYQFPGVFQQYMVLNETILNYGPVAPIPEGLSFNEAALAEPLACAINGLELARFSLGKSICIIGFVSTEQEDLVETVMRETDGEGVDLAITTAGTVQAHEDAIRMVRHRGYVNLFGGLKNQPKLRIDSNLIHYKECFVMGSHGSLPHHHQKAVQLIARGDVQAARYVSKVFPLQRINDAFEFHESRKGLKVVVDPQG